jgi:hypothetical protein
VFECVQCLVEGIFGRIKRNLNVHAFHGISSGRHCRRSKKKRLLSMKYGRLVS